MRNPCLLLLLLASSMPVVAVPTDITVRVLAKGIDPDACTADHPQLGRGFDHPCRHLGTAADHQRVVVTDDLGDFFFAQPRAIVDL